MKRVERKNEKGRTKQADTPFALVEGGPAFVVSRLDAIRRRVLCAIMYQVPV